ncbi:uncharacterized protein LOC113641559 isoform X2 [Tachysurus fulvidraco]|uniref:uncharacterized protein LOC113641559 isoform X2 n=1 Tax=Tachysurus fulvidraco TaxID=1234273 RepID=UPI001FEEFF2A|nr:uncharacterized protein LOC113641559 isoform X2 [Tachysurus fulvidraco]
MAKFEYLNTFFTERLLALAGELFQVVTDVITEYQEETDRTKQENIYLKEMLTAERLANGRGADEERVHQCTCRTPAGSCRTRKPQ